MGLFNTKKEDDIVEAKTVKEEKSLAVEKVAKKVDKKVADTKNVVDIPNDGQMAYDFIVKPWITEKAQELMASNKYIFRLRAKTTKREAKVAVERLYNVRVESVNMINIPSKKKRFGRSMGMKSAVRKAVVTLKKGDKIEIFE